MTKLYIIGTLHAGLTPNEELEEVLREYEPQQLLVEIAQEDIDSDDISKYPSEMVFAYNWARKNELPVAGFDCKMNTFKTGKTSEDNENLIEKQKASMGKLTWKDMNKSENDRILNSAISEDENVVDAELEKIRNEKMVENIKRIKAKNGNIVVLTGCAHLDFFQTSFPMAVLPLREDK